MMTCCKVLSAVMFVSSGAMLASCGVTKTGRAIIEAHNKISANPDRYFKPEHFSICAAKAKKPHNSLTGNTTFRVVGPARHFKKYNCYWKELSKQRPVHGMVIYALATPIVVTSSTGTYAFTRPVGQKMVFACIFEIRDGKVHLDHAHAVDNLNVDRKIAKLCGLKV